MTDPAHRSVFEQVVHKATTEIERCLSDPGATLRIDEVSANRKIWVAALDRILDEKPLAQSQSVAERLHAAFPNTAYLNNVMTLLREAPPADPGEAEIEPAPAWDVPAVRHSRAVATLLVFTGKVGRVGMPLRIADRWFAARSVNRVYLHDRNANFYHDGDAVLGQSFDAMVSGLRQLHAEFGCSRLLCYGNSGGGYAALRCALALEAEAVLVFSGATNITRAFAGDEAMDRYGAVEQPDLRPAFAAATRPPRTRLVYAQDHAVDARQASNFRGLRGVICDPIPGTGAHNVVVDVIRSGRYGDMLDWLVGRNRQQTGKVREDHG